MATSTTINSKKPCSICGSEAWVLACEGCQTSFCLKHAPDHRNQLTIELNRIQEEYNILEHVYTEHEKYQDHPLFSQIDVWEHDAITKIEHVAQTARDELGKLINDSNNRMKILFEQFNNQLQLRRQTEAFTEIELNQWKQELINIKKQLETSNNIQLITDTSLPPIYLIKIDDTTKENVSSSFSQSIQSDNLECSDENVQSAITETHTECTSTAKECEPSVISKEECPISFEIPLTANGRYLDPARTSHLVLLQLSSKRQSQLLTIVNQLTDAPLQIYEDRDACLNQLRLTKQTTIFIDLFDAPLNQQTCFLDNISELENIYSVYIRGMIPSNDDNERQDFFRRYSKVKAMFPDEQRLMVQWALDTSNEYKTIGDIYVKNGEKDKGRRCFEQGITLYKRLSIFLNKKRDIR